jgi:hypothetical protein
MILEKPTQAFGDATNKTSKINNLFIQHQNNTYFGALEYSWKLKEDPLKKLVVLTLINGVNDKKSRF